MLLLWRCPRENAFAHKPISYKPRATSSWKTKWTLGQNSTPTSARPHCLLKSQIYYSKKLIFYRLAFTRGLQVNSFSKFAPTISSKYSKGIMILILQCKYSLTRSRKYLLTLTPNKNHIAKFTLRHDVTWKLLRTTLMDKKFSIDGTPTVLISSTYWS